MWRWMQVSARPQLVTTHRVGSVFGCVRVRAVNSAWQADDGCLPADSCQARSPALLQRAVRRPHRPARHRRPLPAHACPLHHCAGVRTTPVCCAGAHVWLWEACGGGCRPLPPQLRPLHHLRADGAGAAAAVVQCGRVGRCQCGRCWWWCGVWWQVVVGVGCGVA